MNIEDIKLVRFKTGEDIIGYVSDINDDRINIKFPMVVITDDVNGQKAYVMAPWLPHQLYKLNETSIWSNDVMFVADATDVFVDYYKEMVVKLEKYITASEIMEHMQDEEELIDALIEKDSNVVH
jgi:hypothetical protein